jgi:hypothetical protein
LKKRKWLFIGGFGGLLIIVIIGVWSGNFLYFGGPYAGRVIDSTTRRPIEGAAVVAVWWVESPFMVQSITYFYDAQETLTDQRGIFVIPGIWGGWSTPLGKIREPLFTIFRPGYKAYKDRRLAPPTEEGQTVVALRHLNSREEKLENLGAGYLGPHVPKGKYPNLSKLRSIERKNLGLKK